ncbi:hypothetical protein EPA93_17510 [Ktedonosporobacter rubrisoli]|uniref:DUF4433 domain-containing protein n=1 Tax=Ktedonosporobacter rubrisoli TaxID=2509675 RepID=A0A4P6JR71_KTERU|nr:hypothetical protein [Ktedonosporobacter rubrisoli]QBD77690.1 hypothetical protein EPA93_17510 [Ktedonosporobacter rubrisoli]
MTVPRDPRLPRFVYHMADALNWPSIERHGLLSTTALLDRAGLAGLERTRLEQQYRQEQMILSNGAIIRDQKPMPPATLERCLQGMTPAQWYALLNSKVFFWCNVDRLNRMRLASRQREQVIMIIDTERLLASHGEDATLTPINTGNALRRAAQRGLQTFVPYKSWLQSGWASEAEALGTTPRPIHHRPVELAITHAVPDALDCLVETRYLKPMKVLDL